VKKSGAGLYRYLVLICANWCDVENEGKYMHIRRLFDGMQDGAGGCLVGLKQTQNPPIFGSWGFAPLPAPILTLIYPFISDS
jgi:hypothetical protein